jgi:DDE superfamily endonuclease
MTMMYFVCVLAVLLILLFDLAVAAEDDDDEAARQFLAGVRLFASTAALLIASLPEGGLDIAEDTDTDEAPQRREGHRERPRSRVRRSIQSIFREYGPYYIRRAYRMNEASFWQLHRLVKPHMSSIRLKKHDRKRQKTHKNGGKNGLISSEIRLSAAIRYFAGGRPDDIAISHGIAHSEVFYSCWKVVDAVNKCPELAFSFPASHALQKELALAFKAKSAAGIDCCVGATDGMLLWIERPGAADCERAHVGAKKFFCGRKHKFGLNMQATCDAEGKFMEVSISHPASTSDFLAFSTSTFMKQIETPGFLAPGLCIFGDAAYVNNGFFMTPFKSVKSGVKDAFNFYHSQLRINIECAFGMFVGRWGILRKALPKSMGLRKINALTFCLCRLHNFCINNREGRKRLLSPLTADAIDITGHGGVPIEDCANGPEQLLHAGHHNDDTTASYRQNYRRAADDGHLPRDQVMQHLERNGFKRPTPVAWLK